ncbi:hypothetical protein [Salinispira pacifica]
MPEVKPPGGAGATDRGAGNGRTRNVLVVDGFEDEGGLDRFVKSEIRYMKGFDMGAYRCKGLRVKFILQDIARFPDFVRELSYAHPLLLFRLLVESEAGGRADPSGFYAFRAGRSVDLPEDASLLAAHETRIPSQETLYETF